MTERRAPAPLRHTDWAQNHHTKATYPASFNSLCLFTVSTKSAHFVTTVSPQAKQLRLAFNGWWQSSWLPSVDDPQLDDVLADEEKRRLLTHTQLQHISDLLLDPWQNIKPERKETLEAFRAQAMAEFFPP